jgi:hypothetical protein
MRRWSVALLILSAILSGCVGFGYGGRAGGDGRYYHHHDWR